jgi:1,4-dihydroxy-2-naphthoate octaprenyltransferase
MATKEASNGDTSSSSRIKVTTSAQIVMADTVQAEEVPTIPLGSMQTVHALQPEVAVRPAAPTQDVRLPAPLVVHPTEYKRGLGEWISLWWHGMRPGYLPLSLLPVLLGTVLAWTQSISASTPRGVFHPQRFLAAFVAVLLLQLGANLVNDYYDYLRGIDTTNPLGPGGLIQQGLVKPARVLSIGLVFLALGALFGILAALSGGLLAFGFGLLGVIVAYFYSATSKSLSSLALGELISFGVFGPLITVGAYMVQTGRFSMTPLIYSVSLGLLAMAFIHLNNMRDTESDLQAGKHTLANALGLRLSRILYVLLMLGAYVPVFLLGIPHHAPHLILITLWTIPQLVVLFSGVLRTDTPASLHIHMQKTLRLEVWFSLLLMVALIFSAFFALLPHLPSFLPI